MRKIYYRVITDMFGNDGDGILHEVKISDEDEIIQSSKKNEIKTDNDSCELENQCECNEQERKNSMSSVQNLSGMTNLQIVVKKISEFCGNCPKNNSDCNPTDGDYCQNLAKYIIDLQSKMTSVSQNT